MAHAVTISQQVREQVQRYAIKLKRAHIPYQSLFVFGSHAKGKAHEWSDVDVCVVSSTFGNDRFSDRLRLIKLTDNDTLDIQPHPLSPEEFIDRWDPLAAEIRRYGIRVTEN